MTSSITIAGTDENGVRVTVAFICSYWQGETDFSGVIVQNKVSSAAMLSTSQIENAGDLQDPIKLTEAQYTALRNNGKPSDAVLIWVKTKIVRGMRGHVNNFEQARAAAALVIAPWDMNGS